MKNTLPWATWVAVSTALTLFPDAASGQWRNRYPHVQGYGHHVYLEGYELPVLTNGPIDPAPSPDGRHIAFSARGWIWVMDLATGTARQLTQGRDMDSRPAWHPSGDRLALVRDNDRDTRIVIVDAGSGADLRTIDTPAIDLDPAFSGDGGTLYYTSGQAGTLDVWALDLATGESRALTTDTGIEMKPQPRADGSFLTLVKRSGDRVELRSADSGESSVLVSGSIASMARPALSPDGSTFALNWPTQDGWELRVHDLARPGPSVLLTSGGLPLTPAWSADGTWIYYAEADDSEIMHLKRIRPVGGPVEEVEVRAWEWADATARLRIRTTLTGEDGALASARLNVLDASGHPAVPDREGVHFDGASGRVFFYSPGVIEVTVPAGEVTVSAVQGLATPEVTATVSAAPGSTAEISLELTPVWDARAAGWASGDHHFHLNYGGQTNLDPTDMIPKMKGEALDVASPLLANLHNRFEDQHMWGWEKSDASPFIRFGQEIRSHFLGHMGLIEIPELHWPWVWGPGYEVYGTDDRTNAEVLDFAHGQGGLGYYVHPVSAPDPFAEGGAGSVPVELVADAVMGDVDALEVMCLWSNSYGTSALWHRFLNLGLTVAPSAGTDVMLNLYRTMAVGTTRVYVHTGDRLNWPAYIEGLREGRSFVTNGPFLDFRVGGQRPGDVVAPGAAAWTLDLATATSVDTVDIIVNGRVVASQPGMASPGQRSYSGEIELPEGGWVAARARGARRAGPRWTRHPLPTRLPCGSGRGGPPTPTPGARPPPNSATFSRLPLRGCASGIPARTSRFWKPASRRRWHGWRRWPRESRMGSRADP